MGASNKRDIEIHWSSSDSEECPIHIEETSNSPILATNKSSVRPEKVRKFSKRRKLNMEAMPATNINGSQSPVLFDQDLYEDMDHDSYKQESIVPLFKVFHEEPKIFQISQFCSQTATASQMSVSSLLTNDINDHKSYNICSPDEFEANNDSKREFEVLDSLVKLDVNSLNSQNISSLSEVFTQKINEAEHVELLTDIKPIKQPKSATAINVMKLCNIQKAKRVIWKHELCKGIDSSSDELAGAIKLKVISSVKEFQIIVVNCQYIDAGDLFNDVDNFKRCLLNADPSAFHYNSIDKSNCIVVVNISICNVIFSKGMQFSLYPPFDIKVNLDNNICYFLNVFKINV